MNLLGKTKTEQEKDIAEFFTPLADPKCGACYGTAKKYWDCDLEQYAICECIETKINEMYAAENLSGQPLALIQKIRNNLHIQN